MSLLNNRINVGRMKRSASGAGADYGNNSGSASLDPAYELRDKGIYWFSASLMDSAMRLR